MKTCIDCKQSLSLDSFWRRSNGYYTSKCKFCSKKDFKVYYNKNKKLLLRNKKEYYENNKEYILNRAKQPEVRKARAKGLCKKKTKNRNLKYKYNSSLEKYEELLLKQDYKCAICKSETPNKGKAEYFDVDHCHKSGIVRGLLCGNCNKILGLAKDNLETLKKSIDYLSKNG